jgi:hypothetical protein
MPEQKCGGKPVMLALVSGIGGKYLLLYLFLMGTNHDDFLAPSIRNAVDLAYYLWLLLALPALEFCLFAAPLYWTLTTTDTKLAAATTLACVLLAALRYYQVASPSDPRNGVIQVLIGGCLQGLLFIKMRQPARLVKAI